MLHWSIALVVIPSLAIFMVSVPSIQHLLTTVARTLYALLNLLAALLSAALDAVLRPSAHDGRSSWSRLLLWVLLNIAAILGIYELLATHQAVEAISAAGLLTGAHVMLVAAAILIIAEDNRVMHLGQPRNGVMFSSRAALRNLAIIALEMALTIASATALLDTVTSAFPEVIIARKPDTGMSFADSLLCVLAALPATSMLVNTTEFAPKIVYGGGPGAIARWMIYFMGSSLLYGAAAACILQRGAISMVLGQLEDADSDDAHFLQLMLSRAPQHIKAELLTLAIDPSKPLVQLRATNIMRHLKVWTFPQTFLHHLDRFQRKVKIVGLQQIREFLATDGPSFEEQLLISATGKAFERYIELAPKIENSVDDGVLSRLGAIISLYMTLIHTRHIGFRTSPAQFGAMLSIARAHKDDDVRRAMVRVLMERSPKGFLMNYLVDLHDRSHSHIDIEIIDGFAEYLGAKWPAFSAEDLDIVARRLNWNILHAGLPAKVIQALQRLQRPLIQPMRDKRQHVVA